MTPVTASRAWLSVVVLLLISLFSYLDRMIISLLVEPIKLSLGASDFQIGLLQGVAFGIFYALFMMPIGWMVDRYPRRIIIYAGTTLWSLAAAACGLAQTYMQLLFARFFVGIGEASLSPSAYSIIADLFPPRRLALALGVFATGAALGGAIALIVGGAVIHHFEQAGDLWLPLIGAVEPWQMVFIVTGLPGVLIAFLIFAVPEPDRPAAFQQQLAAGADAKADPGLYRFLRANKRYLVCHFMGFGLLSIVAYGGSAWIPTFLMRKFGLNAAEIGLQLGLITGAAAIPGFILSGWIVDRWFAKGTHDAHQRYFIVAMLLTVVAMVVAFQLSDDLTVVMAALAAYFFLTPFTGPSVAHLQLATPYAYRGRVSALFVLVFNLMGMCLGPPSVGFVTDYVLGDKDQLPLSLTIVTVTGLLLGCAFFIAGLPAARRAIREAGAAG